MDLIVPNYGDRNSKRLPNYHRLDLSLKLIPKKEKNYEREWVFGIYNIYNRDNANSLFFRENPDTLKMKLSNSQFLGLFQA